MISPFGIRFGGGSTPVTTPVGAKLIKTGQITSYATGDDGGLQEGRDVSFTVLPTNNPFGNADRFTDTLGGNIYANNIVIDWSTLEGTRVLGYYKIIAGNQTWADALNSANTLSVGTFTNGWRMTNVRELINIFCYRGGIAHALDYTPFSTTITTVHSLWTSTTCNDNTANAFRSFTTIGGIGALDKTTAAGKFLAVRTFAWDGTQLN